MPKGETRHELILLFHITGKEPKKLHEFLKSRGFDIPYPTLKKYYGYYGTARLVVDSIITGSKK